MSHFERIERSDSDSTYYSVLKLAGDGMSALRELFSTGDPDDLNFVLFSTSGVHGSYCTIESCEAGEVPDVTFLIIHPRIVCMKYGNVAPKTPEDFAFLKRLREKSKKAIMTIGGAE